MKKFETQINNSTLLVLLLIVSLLFYYIIGAYLIAIFYAAVLAGISRPIYNWFLDTTQNKHSISAILTIFVIIFAVLTPVIGMAFLLGTEIVDVGNSLAIWLSENQNIDSGVSGVVQKIPMIESVFPNHAELDQKVHDLVQKLLAFITSSLSHILSGSANFIVKTIISLFVLFYFLVNGDHFIERIIFLIPMRKDYKEELFGRFLSVSRATLRGSGVVAVVQGIVGGIAMMVAGVPHTILWGFLIGISSLIPSIGTAIIWIPACIYLFIQGKVFAGAGLLIFCVVILGNLDNVLRPMLVGKNANLPDMLIFLSTMGGIGIFGISGIIIGPLIAALFVSLWQMYENTFKDILGKVSIADIEPVHEAIVKKSKDSHKDF